MRDRHAHQHASERAGKAVEYAILGPLEARVGGRRVQLGGARQRAVLVCLLVRPNAVVSATRIVDEVWPDNPPATAVNLVQGYVSNLRKALGRTAIATEGAGYRIRVESLDLLKFERLTDLGARALDDDRAYEARGAFRAALDLWRGRALGDLADEHVVQPFVARLEELRLLASQRLVEAELACGRDDEAAAEAALLVHEHPLRERPRALLMLALYRCGRQAEALRVYREGRELLVAELGIEPGEELRELERAILRHEPELAARGGAGDGAGRRPTIVVGSFDAAALDGLLETIAPLARDAAADVVVALTVADAADLGDAARGLERRRYALAADGVSVRTAAFTSLTPGADVARIANEQHADIVLVAAPERTLEDARLIALLDDAACDVAVLVGGAMRNGPVVVPFTGVEHDWAAIELGGWLARATGSALQVVGAAAFDGARDASMLLGNASLAVQRTLGVAAQPVLVDPTGDALIDATRDAGVVVVGLTERWRRDGLGRARSALAAQSERPTLLVHRGLRPGALAPARSATRFTWTVTAG
jgi:DNA-binding SARP family transcriptional activator